MIIQRKKALESSRDAIDISWISLEDSKSACWLSCFDCKESRNPAGIPEDWAQIGMG